MALPESTEPKSESQMTAVGEAPESGKGQETTEGGTQLGQASPQGKTGGSGQSAQTGEDKETDQATFNGGHKTTRASSGTGASFKARRSPRAEKYIRFFMFGVALSLTPFLLSVVDDSAQKAPITLGSVLGHGDLAILGVIIAGGAAGEIFLGDSPRLRRAALAMLGGCIMIFVVTVAGWFSNVSLLASTKHPDPPHQVAVQSICAFGAAVVIGLAALRMSGE